MISISGSTARARQWSRSIIRSAARKSVLSIRSQGTASCHHPVHAEQQAIVGMPRIIESVLVYDDGPDKSTELDQRMPVAAVAGQPRCLDRKYGADPPLTDRSQQALEARPIDAASRAARSSSMTSTEVQPSCRARSASPY